MRLRLTLPNFLAHLLLTILTLGCNKLSKDTPKVQMTTISYGRPFVGNRMLHTNSMEVTSLVIETITVCGGSTQTIVSSQNPATNIPVCSSDMASYPRLLKVDIVLSGVGQDQRRYTLDLSNPNQIPSELQVTRKLENNLIVYEIIDNGGTVRGSYTFASSEKPNSPDFVLPERETISSLNSLWSKDFVQGKSVSWTEGTQFFPADSFDTKFVPIPDHPGFYLHRHRIGVLPNGAEQMGLDISNLQLDGTFVRSAAQNDQLLVDPRWGNHFLGDDRWQAFPIQGGAYYVYNAIDPDVVRFAGSLWVIFEGGLLDGNGAYVGSSATLVAPMEFSPTTGRFSIKQEHMRVLILGKGASVPTGTDLSASVPHFLVHRENLFVYWSAVTIFNGKFQSIKSRGMRVVPQPEGNTLIPDFFPDTIPSDHPQAHDVWVPETASPTLNTVADIYQVLSDGEHVFAVAGLGGATGSKTCINQFGTAPGCYRVGMSRSATPLGEHIFNRERLPDGILPGFSHEHSGFFVRSHDKKLILIANYPFITVAYTYLSTPIQGPVMFALNSLVRPKLSYVIRLYQYLLGRSPSDSEIEYWSGKGKVLPPNAVFGVASSREAYIKIAKRFYSVYLGRTAQQIDADANGVSNLADILGEQGYLAAAAYIVKSSEFSITHPGVCDHFCDPEWQKSDFINSQYQALLRRPPNPEELQAGVLKFQMGPSGWQSSPISILESSEYRIANFQ